MLQIEFKESGPTAVLSFSTLKNELRSDIGVITLPRHTAESLLSELVALDPGSVTVVRATDSPGKPILDGDARVKNKRQF